VAPGHGFSSSHVWREISHLPFACCSKTASQRSFVRAETPVAFASLWRFLLDLDLTREISYGYGWVDDPLAVLLLDPRGVTRTEKDHVWLRIVDLDRAIGLRGYGAEANVVVEITDSFTHDLVGRIVGPQGASAIQLAGN